MLTYSLELVNQIGNIRCKQAGSNCQQDDTKELTDEVNTTFTQQMLYLISHLQHDIHPYHVQDQSNDNVECCIFRTERKQGGERTGPLLIASTV